MKPEPRTRLVVVKLHPEITPGYLSVENVRMWGREKVEALPGMGADSGLATALGNLSMSSP